MKIGLVLDTTLDSDAGVQQYFKGLARFLLSRSCDVKFIVPPSLNEGEFEGRIISLGRNINPLGNVTGVPFAFYLGGRSQIREILNKERFNILHVSAPFSPFLGAKIVREAECPVVVTYHTFTKNSLYRFGAVLLRLLLYKAYQKIDYHIAVSNIAKLEAEKVIPGKYRLIPNAVDIVQFSPEHKPLEKFKDEKFNIMFLGRLERRKGVEYLIRAFKKVQKEVQRVREGDEGRRLKDLTERLGLKDVVFEGYIDEKLKPRYYASSNLCVFPATWGESFGIVLIEAMASGKVPIAFANEGYSFVLRNLPELLVENKDVDKLATKIVRFVKDNDLRREYEKECLIEKEKFGWERVGSQILLIYKKLLESHSSRNSA
jgi:phosphatidylinositol alpha-mannosyltransferase